METLSSLQAALLLTVTEVVGDTAAKSAAHPLLSYGSYVALAYELQHVLPSNNLSLTNAYWNAFTNVTHALLGAYVFGETLSSQQYAGLGLVTLGIVLLTNGSGY